MEEGDEQENITEYPENKEIESNEEEPMQDHFPIPFQVREIFFILKTNLMSVVREELDGIIGTIGPLQLISTSNDKRRKVGNVSEEKEKGRIEERQRICLS